MLVHAGDPPKVLGDYMEKDKMIRAEVVQMVIPDKFYKFDAMILKLKKKDPKWFADHMKKAPKGDPIPPYDKKLGVTKEEYDMYIKLWNQREYRKVKDGDLVLKLTETLDGKWTIVKLAPQVILDKETKKRKTIWVYDSTGLGAEISSLAFDPKKGTFSSMNGELKRIGDIDSPAANQYGAWKGHEWRFFEKGSLSAKKENIAIGRTGDKKYGILIYSRQEVSKQGFFVEDKQFIIRFIPKKAE